MAETFIGVRDVDEETFRKFKLAMAMRNLKLGDALTMAMKNILEEKDSGTKKGVKSLLSLKPFNFGEGSNRLSKEVDKILYG